MNLRVERSGLDAKSHLLYLGLPLSASVSSPFGQFFKASATMSQRNNQFLQHGLPCLDLNSCFSFVVFLFFFFFVQEAPCSLCNTLLFCLNAICHLVNDLV